MPGSESGGSAHPLTIRISESFRRLTACKSDDVSDRRLHPYHEMIPLATNRSPGERFIAATAAVEVKVATFTPTDARSKLVMLRARCDDGAISPATTPSSASLKQTLPGASTGNGERTQWILSLIGQRRRRKLDNPANPVDMSRPETEPWFSATGY
jgi:hypothetical protein